MKTARAQVPDVMHAPGGADCSSKARRTHGTAAYTLERPLLWFALQQAPCTTRERRGVQQMTRKLLISLGLSLSLGLAAIGCGDDEDDDKNADVKIQAPGVDVKADTLT